MESGSLPETNNAPVANSQNDGARILIVDDNRINLKKMQMSTRTLGHDSELAENGNLALDKLGKGSFDVVLLDLVMPEMDGFDVLRALKADKSLSHIPVIVVTALDEQTDSVVKAIELGAEDVLPKDFNPVLLKARLDASLAKKRYRDQEIAYFKRVDSLTQAAEVIESGRFSGDKLELDSMASQSDSLGKLAAVFKGMATEIYNRELKLRRSLHLIVGSSLVVLIGVVWGASPALSRMLAGAGSNPLGLAVWTNLIITVSCLLVATYQGALPKLTRSDVKFFVAWAAIAGVSQRLVTYWVSEHVEATMLSLIVTLQGFMVFAFAAITKLEKATPQRLIGLTIGLAGVALVLWSKFDFTALRQSIWLLVAILLPLLFAIEAIVLAGKRPEQISIFASLGIMTGISTLMLLPLAIATESLIPFGPSIGKLELLTILLSIASSTSVLMSLYLISLAGSVFYSQTAYTMTLAGVVWGMLLLGETLPVVAWFAFVLICVGVYLVEPKPSSDDIIIRRSFTTTSTSEDKTDGFEHVTTRRRWTLRLVPVSLVTVAGISCVLLLNAMVSMPAQQLPTAAKRSISVSLNNAPQIVEAPEIPMDANQTTGHGVEKSLSMTPIKSAGAQSQISPMPSYSSLTIPPIVNSVSDNDRTSASVVDMPPETSNATDNYLPFSQYDPFAELVVSAYQSELRFLTPGGLERRIALAQGTRLTPLAGNGRWFQVKTPNGDVGFVPAADTINAAFRQTPVLYTH